MWVDTVGVAHTVAVLDPATLMDPVFRAALAALAEHASDDILELLEELEMAVYDDVAVSKQDPEIEELFEHVPPPKELLTGTVTSPAALRKAIEGTDPRWRLDAIAAIGDFLDQ
jgi:hypothetical protein